MYVSFNWESVIFTVLCVVLVLFLVLSVIQLVGKLKAEERTLSELEKELDIVKHSVQKRIL
jgi:uncharacterized protein YoxC